MPVIYGFERARYAFCRVAQHVYDGKADATRDRICNSFACAGRRQRHYGVLKNPVAACPQREARRAEHLKQSQVKTSQINLLRYCYWSVSLLSFIVSLLDVESAIWLRKERLQSAALHVELGIGLADLREVELVALRIRVLLVDLPIEFIHGSLRRHNQRPAADEPEEMAGALAKLQELRGVDLGRRRLGEICGHQLRCVARGVVVLLKGDDKVNASVSLVVLGRQPPRIDALAVATGVEQQRPRLADGTQRLLVRLKDCLLYTSPSPRDMRRSRMPSSA